MNQSNWWSRRTPSIIGWAAPTLWAAFLIVVPPASGIRPDVSFSIAVLLPSVVVALVTIRYCPPKMIWLAGPALLFIVLVILASSATIVNYIAGIWH